MSCIRVLRRHGYEGCFSGHNPWRLLDQAYSFLGSQDHICYAEQARVVAAPLYSPAMKGLH